jgi:hypothetical protein
VSPDLEDDPRERFVRWNPSAAAQDPELAGQVAGFTARDDIPAAQAAAHWLRTQALLVPVESVTRLWVVDDELLGFYALANGSLTINKKQRERHGLRRPTQPAVFLTWIAKGAGVERSADSMLFDAIANAIRVAEDSAATLFALDPFDEQTAEMWRRKHSFNGGHPDDRGKLLPCWMPLDL